MADGSITVEVSTQAAQAEVERLRAENAALKHDLQYARCGLTKGRTRMREDNERLRAALLEADADARRWRKLRDTPATHMPPGPMRQWLFARPGGADSMDRMVDEWPGPNVRGNADPTARGER